MCSHRSPSASLYVVDEHRFQLTRSYEKTVWNPGHASGYDAWSALAMVNLHARPFTPDARK